MCFLRLFSSHSFCEIPVHCITSTIQCAFLDCPAATSSVSWKRIKKKEENRVYKLKDNVQIWKTTVTVIYWLCPWVLTECTCTYRSNMEIFSFASSIDSLIDFTCLADKPFEELNGWPLTRMVDFMCLIICFRYLLFSIYDDSLSGSMYTRQQKKRIIILFIRYFVSNKVLNK